MLKMFLILLPICFNLIACTSISGDVIPPSGPTMEMVYDGMGKASRNITQQDQQRIVKNFRQSDFENRIKAKGVYGLNGFRKLPNPELKFYVYPHLAGNDQLPVPGYFTVLNVYEKDHYALMNEN